ncbi:hypothetical protein QBC34DRAFT_465751 [Podospora aff. communis PSN243]|uniref:Uncharacterized protein n=1 Tax=Podospora aff. communis PSN243 TaxID=3040156 RepID=A0AAV9GL28_9PEZI|nr:hypothetical protein QBC34DRAFT_465751 [Podospora aff. communis PSN243]
MSPSKAALPDMDYCLFAGHRSSNDLLRRCSRRQSGTQLTFFRWQSYKDSHRTTSRSDKINQGRPAQSSWSSASIRTHQTPPYAPRDKMLLQYILTIVGLACGIVSGSPIEPSTESKPWNDTSTDATNDLAARWVTFPNVDEWAGPDCQTDYLGGRELRPYQPCYAIKARAQSFHVTESPYCFVRFWQFQGCTGSFYEFRADGNAHCIKSDLGNGHFRALGSMSFRCALG